MTIEVPGVAAADIAVNLHDGVLTVRGRQGGAAAAGPGDAKTLWRERAAPAAFQRQFTVPKTVDADRVSAHLHNGVLELVLPKLPPAPKAGPKAIPVTVADDEGFTAVSAADAAEEPAAAETAAAAADAAAEATAPLVGAAERGRGRGC